MNKYKVIFDTDVIQLVNTVNEYLSNGWKCQGGICVFMNDNISNRPNFYQAIVKQTCTQD